MTIAKPRIPDDIGAFPQPMADHPTGTSVAPSTSNAIVISQFKSDVEGRAWDALVNSHPDSTHCHLWGWKDVIEKSFGWKTFYLAATQDGSLRGVLPLVWQKSRLFGSFLTSMPFLNAGGILAGTPEAERALLDEAVRIAKENGAAHIELRHRRELQLGLPTKTAKITLVRPVEPDCDKMLANLDKKVRADVRKSMKSDFRSEFGHQDFVDDFYRVFALNMRDLGTPVYARSFFENIVAVFPDSTHICRVLSGNTVAATSFLIAHKGSIEAVWSSSVRKYLLLKPNMFLYWNLLCFSGQRGYTQFDFGRSSVGSGTHRFKLQWGTQEVQLYWQYWTGDGAALPELNPHNPKYRAAIWAWQHSPLWLTKAIGPRIVRCLP
jgi:serine/alanine adding enzyme